MPDSNKCSRCGAGLPPDAPGGHCISCLLQLGLEAGETANGPPESSAKTLPSEKTGDRFGRYKLLQQIGEGGCGAVYMADQEEPVRRRVALKVIKLGMDTRQVIARFEAERQALSMMDHPNIAKVLDAGATEAGRPYFVMELVRGIKITDYCDQQKLSTHQRIDLFVQVCQAVQHAHQKGIIHRDIKPSNILVTEQDGRAVPKIIDFGIAKATSAAPLTDKTLFTAFEQFIGTPAYMSPEQAGLGGLDIDTRSDIYSLGVLLYELLTGKQPFDPAELRRVAIDEILRIIREKEPPRPSARLTTLTGQELTTLAERRQTESVKFTNLLRGDLDWIVMKALEKDRTRRYETANGLARDIQRHLDCEPVLARPPSRLYEFQKTVRRHKVGFSAAGTICLVLLLGVAALAYGLKRAKAERDSARAVSYAADMHSCWQAWRWSDYPSCRRLLAANIPQPGERDLRSFEWWYLWRLCRSDDLFSLGTVPGIIGSLGFLPGGRLIAGAWQIRAPRADDVATNGGALFVWDLNSHRFLTEVKTGGVSDLSVSPDGTRIALANWGKEIQILDSTSYAIVTNISYTNQTTNLEFSPDGRFLAVRGERCVYLHNLLKASPPQILPAFENNLEKPAFSADGRLLAYTLPEGKLGIWDLNAGRLAMSLPNLGDGLFEGKIRSGPSVILCRHSFSPDGSWVASGDWFGRTIIHDLKTRTVRLIWQHSAAFATVAISPDGKILACASWDGIVKSFDPVTGQELAEHQGQDSAIWSLLFSPGGEYVVSGGKDGRVLAWDPRLDLPPDKEGSASLNSHPDCVISSNGRFLVNPIDRRPPPPARQDTVLQFNAGVMRALSPNGRFMAYCGANGPGRIVDLESGAEISSFLLEEGESIRGLSQDGQLVATTFVDGRMLLREPRLSTSRPIPKAHNSLIGVLAFSPVDHVLATAGPDGWLRVWNGRDLRLITQAPLPGNPPFGGSKALTFDPGGRLVAYGGATDSRVLLVELSPLKPARYLSMPFNGWDTRALAFSPDGRLLAATSGADQAALIDWRSGNTVAFIGENTPGWDRVAFTPDGRRIMLGMGRYVTFWDIETKRELLDMVLNGNHFIDQLQITPNGDKLVLTVDDTCRVFSAPRSIDVGVPSSL